LRPGEALPCESAGSAHLVFGDRQVRLRLLWRPPPLEECFCALRPQQHHQTRNRRRVPSPPLSIFLRIASGEAGDRTAGVNWQGAPAPTLVGRLPLG
jgi:hypothetical protein